ncbi:MAG TPA: heavy metal-associated domain-containing protein [Geobacteraceae bacterium]
MEKKNLVNLLLVVAAVLLLAVFALSVRLEALADRVAVMKADCIARAGCVAGIARVLEAEHGVASVSVDEAAGRVVIGYDSQAVTPEALVKRVTAAGYGCRVLQTQTFEEYRKTSGGALPVRPTRKCWCEMDKQ